MQTNKGPRGPNKDPGNEEKWGHKMKTSKERICKDELWWCSLYNEAKDKHGDNCA